VRNTALYLNRTGWLHSSQGLFVPGDTGLTNIVNHTAILKTHNRRRDDICFLFPDGGYRNLRPSVFWKTPDGNNINIMSRVIKSLFSQQRGLRCPSATSYPPPNRKHHFKETMSASRPTFDVVWAATSHAMIQAHHRIHSVLPRRCCSCRILLRAVQWLLRTQACKFWHPKQSYWWPRAWRRKPPTTFVSLSMASVQARGEFVLPTTQQNYTYPKYTLHCQKLHVFSNALAPTRLRQRKMRPTHTKQVIKISPYTASLRFGGNSYT